MHWIALVTDNPLRRLCGPRWPALAVPLRSAMITAFLFAAQATMAFATAPSALDLHSVECIAALEVKADELAMQVKAGHTELRASLLATLDAGAAFIGNAYLQGDRDEGRLQTLLDVALQTQKALSDADLATRQATCTQEGTRLLAEANFIGRAVVSRLVERRIQKVLGN